MSSHIQEVEAHSRSLRKELSAVDLALTQILYIVGSGWVGTAAKLGHAHVAYWLLAMAAFFLPQAAVVIDLNRLMPLEGGIYQWASGAFGKDTGFLVAWNLWAYAMLILALLGVVVAQNLSYVIGPVLPALTGARWYAPLVTLLTLGGVTIIALRGLGVGKWVQNIGGAGQVLTYSALLIVPYIALRRGLLHAYHPLQATVPTITTYNLNVFSKMGVGALSGFEYVALLAGECRSPARTIGRSVMVAAPVVALMFILGTDSVLALVPANHIDLVSPIAQTLSIGFAGLSFARLIVPALILVLMLRSLGNSTLLMTGNSRLPMVAGWDGLLPAWFTRLDPRWRTPRNSILFVAGVAVTFGLAAQVGVGTQEAFQLLDNAGGVFYALTYSALFAIPLIGARRLGVRPPLWLRLGAVAGLGTSLLYAVLTIVPIIPVPDRLAFAAKILVVALGANLLGAGILWAGRAAAHEIAPVAAD